MSLEEKWEGLSDELKEKVQACTGANELVSLAKTEGLELSDEELDAVAGGNDWSSCVEYDEYT